MLLLRKKLSENKLNMYRTLQDECYHRVGYVEDINTYMTLSDTY